MRGNEREIDLFGGMYDMVPHTRPLVVSGLGTGENVERDYRIANARASSYEGPTTITYTVSQTAAQNGVETRAFVVHLPQYLNLDDDHQGAARMMDLLCRLYNLPGLHRADRTRPEAVRRTDPNDGQIPSGDVLTRIEEMYDNEYGGDEQTEPTTPLPSSIEEFLQGLGADLGDDEENPLASLHECQGWMTNGFRIGFHRRPAST